MTNSRTETQAIILAAGKSQRFGAPKVLQNFHGIPFLIRIYKNLQRIGIVKPVLVLGHQAQTLVEKLPNRHAFRIVVNPDYETGMFSSIQKALATLPPTTRHALLCLIDQPHIHSRTYLQLIQAVEQNEGAVIIPTYQDKGGHPIVLPSEIFPLILSASPQSTLRDVLRQAPMPTVRLTVEDIGIVYDIDTPEDLQFLESLIPKNDDDPF